MCRLIYSETNTELSKVRKLLHSWRSSMSKSWCLTPDSPVQTHPTIAVKGCLESLMTFENHFTE